MRHSIQKCQKMLKLSRILDLMLVLNPGIKLDLSAL